MIIVRDDTDDIKGADDLRGKKVAVLGGGTTCELAAMEHTDDSLILRHDYDYELIEELKSKNADAIIIDYVIGADIVNKNPSLKMVQGQITEEYYGIATRIGNDSLINEINEIIREFKRDGVIEELEKKWL